MKAYTDIEQSKRLAEILPIESADMSYSLNFNSGIYEISTTSYNSWVIPKYAQPDNGFGQVIPCWSLAALLGVIPEVSLNTFKDGIWNAMVLHDGKMIYVNKNNPVDACYELILKLHKQKIL